MPRLFLLITIVSIPSLLMGQTVMADHYTAGFKSIHFTDSTRLYKGNTSRDEPLHFRPIEVDIWYPSKDPVSEPLVFGDLFKLLEQRAMAYQDDTDYAGLTEELAAFYVAQLGIESDGKALLDIPTNSMMGLTPSANRHPVILYMAGFNGMGFENYKILEKLAENGFIVLAIASVGRYPGDMTNQKEDMLEQVYDAEYALEHLINDVQYFNIDVGRMGIMGCSWGGMSAAAFASRNLKVKGMVSLDGTETHYFGETDMNLYADGASGEDNDLYIREIHDSDLLNPKGATFEYLYLESGDKLDDFQPTGEYHYFKELGSEKYYLRLTNSTHSDFLSIPSILNASETSVAIYAKIENACVHFFNSTLKGTDTFQPFWADLQAGEDTTPKPFVISKSTIQTRLIGRVIDRNTSQPLPFVNVGVLHQDWGTVTDSLGQFNLALKEGFKDDTLRISMIGYNTTEALIKETVKSDSLIVRLSESRDELEEVVIKASAYKQKTLGNKTQSKFLGTGFGYDQLGAEMGIKVEIKNQPTFVDAFNFTITYNRLSAETIFRLNFYDLEKGQPGDNILKENIFITINPKQTGAISVDLRPYNIILKEDVLATLEWVGSNGANKKGEGIYFPLSLVSKGTYFKASSQARFKKHNSLGVGFNIDVTY